MGRMSLGTKIKVGISATLILLVVLASNPVAVGQALTGVDPWFIFLVIVLYLINSVFKAYRWGVLMRHAGHEVSFRSIFTAFSLSQAINNLIPGRVVGETSRIVEINSKEGISVGKGLATVVTERIMDFIVLTLLTVTSLFLLLASIVEELRGYLIFLVTLMVIINVFVIYILARPAIMVRVGAWGSRSIARVVKGERGERLANKMMRTVFSFNEAMAFKGSLRHVAWAAVLTGFIWVNEIARLYLIIMALGVDASLVAVIATASLASLSAVVLSAGSGNVIITSAIFTAIGMDVHVAATAGLLSALTSIWLSVPVCLITMLVDHRLKHSSMKKRTIMEKDRGELN